MFVSGFLMTLGARPRNAYPVFIKVCICLKIPKLEMECFVRMKLCISARTISKGCVKDVAIIPDKNPATKLLIPNDLPSW